MARMKSDTGSSGDRGAGPDWTRSWQSDTPTAMEPEQKPPQGAPREPGFQGALPEAPKVESIGLGSGGVIEVNDHGVPLVVTRPKPRGLLPIPPEVETIVAKEEARLLSEKGIVPTPEARQRMVDSFTLQYYYEGFYVAYRPTPQGLEVLAVGPEEIGDLVRGMSQEERLKIKVGQP